MHTQQSTIFAPASLIGESSISVIRISGNDAFEIVTSIFSNNRNMLDKIKSTSIEANTVHHGYIFCNDEMIDEVVCAFFKSPHSFTGEDVVEISSHGGYYVYKSISKLLTEKGCEPAEPGEFSKRAFLNGKMDLAQAEAVSDLIRARTELASKAALKQLRGLLSEHVKSLRDELINYCSLVELELDFAEEGLDIISKDMLIKGIDKNIQIIENMAKSYDAGRIIKDGINLAIVGQPNAGKSSIFNYLLKANRAIVSHIPGTTRDYIEEPLILGGIIFNLIDTAGIRETENLIEKEGVRRSYEKINEADIVLEVVDLTNSDNIKNYGENDNKSLLVMNKADLVTTKPKGLFVSALTGENMTELESELIKRAEAQVANNKNTEFIITNERHKAQLLKSCEYLVNAKKLALTGAGNELISLEIRDSMAALEEIIGKTTNVDILNNIFSKFCIGK
jgi:tRNA modification GTPase